MVIIFQLLESQILQSSRTISTIELTLSSRFRAIRYFRLCERGSSGRAKKRFSMKSSTVSSSNTLTMPSKWTNISTKAKESRKPIRVTINRKKRQTSLRSKRPSFQTKATLLRETLHMNRQTFSKISSLPVRSQRANANQAVRSCILRKLVYMSSLWIQKSWIFSIISSSKIWKKITSPNIVRKNPINLRFFCSLWPKTHLWEKLSTKNQ